MNVSIVECIMFRSSLNDTFQHWAILYLNILIFILLGIQYSSFSWLKREKYSYRRNKLRKMVKNFPIFNPNNKIVSIILYSWIFQFILKAGYSAFFIIGIFWWKYMLCFPFDNNGFCFLEGVQEIQFNVWLTNSELMWYFLD
jgi:hypothetical protein